MTTKAADVFYFAYGSNLNAQQKEKRTGRIREARRARLPGYRLAFNKRAAGGGVNANIVPQVGDEVWGVLYRCTPAALSEMDHYEGVAEGHYDRALVTVLLEDGQQVEAITYVAGQGFICSEGLPRKDYLERIVRGARDYGLPEDYVRRIARLGTGQNTAV